MDIEIPTSNTSRATKPRSTDEEPMDKQIESIADHALAERLLTRWSRCVQRLADLAHAEENDRCAERQRVDDVEGGRTCVA